jgi:hypothetical protein
MPSGHEQLRNDTAFVNVVTEGLGQCVAWDAPLLQKWSWGQIVCASLLLQ